MELYYFAKRSFALTSLFFICAQALPVSQNDQIQKNISTNGLASTLTEKNVHFSNAGITQHELIILLGASRNTATEKEIADYVHFPTNQANAAYFYKVAGELFKFLQQTTNNTVFSNTNAIFVQKGVHLDSLYSAQVVSFYKPKTFILNFANESSNAIDGINQYVSNHTEGRIRNHFSEPLRTDTQLVHSSAQYFKSEWTLPFSEPATNDSIFNTGSENVAVKMMSNTGLINYGEIPALESKFIQLPLTDSKFEVTIILPSNIRALDKALNLFIQPDPAHYVSKTEHVYVNYKIPKMKLKNSLNLKKVLQDSGVEEVFTDKADLMNMITDKRLKIFETTCIGEIEIDEKGIEASAVEISQFVPIGAAEPSAVELSKVVSRKVEEQPKSIDFILDRPFLLMVRANGLTSPLFLSAVYNPNEH